MTWFLMNMVSKIGIQKLTGNDTSFVLIFLLSSKVMPISILNHDGMMTAILYFGPKARFCHGKFWVKPLLAFFSNLSCWKYRGSLICQLVRKCEQHKTRKMVIFYKRIKQGYKNSGKG